MGRTGRTRRGAPVRLGALLAVVLGLLGMHGLASTHHAAAAALVHVASAGATANDEPVLPRDRAPLDQHDHVSPGVPDPAARAAWLLGGAIAGPAVAVCDDDCPTGPAVLCAAILAAAAAAVWLIAATAGRRVPATRERSGPPARAPAGARLLLPGPDTVVELCVSRT